MTEQRDLYDELVASLPAPALEPERQRRLRGAIGECAADLDPDEHAAVVARMLAGSGLLRSEQPVQEAGDGPVGPGDASREAGR